MIIERSHVALIDWRHYSGGDGSFHFHSSGGNQEIDPDELFEAFFGTGGGNSRRRNRGPRNGADLQMHVRLSFQEAVMGECEERFAFAVQDTQ